MGTSSGIRGQTLTEVIAPSVPTPTKKKVEDLIYFQHLFRDFVIGTRKASQKLT